ncbi:cytochrome c oxidase assembly protein [Mesorhizobium sp. CO1-1-9]|nr:cytochrome c oxidase assembly protein [Mesorhizobium sp. CO1-1-9]
MEHELLMAVAAPLLVAACPGAVLIWALPAALRRGTGRLTHGRILQAIWTVASRPLNATVIHGIAIWIWHVPVLFEAALQQGVLHYAQHASFLGTALLFWWGILPRSGRQQAYGSAVMHLFFTSLHTGPTLWSDRRDRGRHESDMATGGLEARAIPIMIANGCSGCHTIPGVPGAQGQVGPRLDSSLADRVFIAGVLANNPENLIRWIRAAREINPHTAMPSTGITEQQARDIAAYLYALK